MQQFICNLDHAAQLKCGQSFLRKAHVGFLNCRTLFNPGSAAGIHSDGDSASTGVGTNGLCHSTEDVVLFQALDQLPLKLIRDSVATILVDADRQGVADFHGVVATHHVPEGLTILSSCGGTCECITLAGFGISMHGYRSCCGELGIHFHLVLHALDLIAQGFHIRSHLFILLDSRGFDQAVLISVLFQEGFCLLPEGIALVTKFDNLTHVLFLH